MATNVVATPGHEPPRLADAAARADDPCDIALAAMPAHAIGDLCVKDEAWLQHHVAECGYCRNEMSCYEKVDSVLGACCAVPEAACVPPLLTLPKRDIVWFTRVASPLGDLILAATDDGLREIEFGRNHTDVEFVQKIKESGGDPVKLASLADAPLATRQTLQRTADELEEYFGGKMGLLSSTVYDVLDRYVEMYGWDAVLPVVRTDIGNISMTSATNRNNAWSSPPCGRAAR